MTSRDPESSNSWPQFAQSPISRKQLEIETPFQSTTNSKWPMGYRMVTWPLSSHDPERSNSWTQYAQSSICQKQLEMLFSKSL